MHLRKSHKSGHQHAQEKNEGEPAGGGLNALKFFMKKIATGGALTHMSLPASLCCPQSALQALAHHRLRGAPNLHGVWQHEDAFVRMVAVLRWYLAAFTTELDGKKPFNPVLGETYQCYADGMWAVLEQVSHHPPVSAYFMLDSDRHTCFFGHAEMCLEFSANAIAVDMIGCSRLVLGVHKPLRVSERDHLQQQQVSDEQRATGAEPVEVIQDEERGEGEWWAKYEHYDFIPPTPTQVVKGLLWGQRRHAYKGDVVVACSRTGFFAHLHFREEGPHGEPDFLFGEIYYEPTHLPVAHVCGQWNGIVEIIPVATALHSIGSRAAADPGVLYRASRTLQPRIIEIVDNRQGGRDSSSVWRLVSEALVRGDFDAAQAAKEEVERQQREMVHRADLVAPWSEPAKKKKNKKKSVFGKTKASNEEMMAAQWGTDEEEERWRQAHPAVFFDRHRSSATGNVEWIVRWDQVRLLADRRDIPL